MANIGGFLCTNNDALAEQEKNLLILTEGYTTYGGLAGRDLEAIAVGVQEALHQDYLEYRIASTAYLGNHIAEQGVPIVQPPGGHAVYIDARAFLPHIAPDHFPAVALANEIYLEGGIRSVEIGTLMFGKRRRWIWCVWRFPGASTRRATSTTRWKSSSKYGRSASRFTA
jgi:tyrosine phenol-lyase